MQKQQSFPHSRFTPEVLFEACACLWGVKDLKELPPKSYQTLSVRLPDGATWSHDTFEEFAADYRKMGEHATFERHVAPCTIRITVWGQHTEVSVQAPAREKIAEVFGIFERNLPESQLPPAPPKPKERPRVFIGHGRSLAWRDLKDHLHEKHGFDVEAYEVGSRAGHAIRDILEEMLSRSAIAFLVLTPEDELADGSRNPRLNVVHEAGLFQGKLGFARAVVLVEEGTGLFSNIEGIEQIRYGKGRVRETFGEVLAVLRREFGA